MKPKLSPQSNNTSPQSKRTKPKLTGQSANVSPQSSQPQSSSKLTGQVMSAANTPPQSSQPQSNTPPQSSQPQSSSKLTGQSANVSPPSSKPKRMKPSLKRSNTQTNVQTRKMIQQKQQQKQQQQQAEEKSLESLNHLTYHRFYYCKFAYPKRGDDSELRIKPESAVRYVGPWENDESNNINELSIQLYTSTIQLYTSTTQLYTSTIQLYTSTIQLYTYIICYIENRHVVHWMTPTQLKTYLNLLNGIQREKEQKEKHKRKVAARNFYFNVWKKYEENGNVLVYDTSKDKGNLWVYNYFWDENELEGLQNDNSNENVNVYEESKKNLANEVDGIPAHEMDLKKQQAELNRIENERLNGGKKKETTPSSVDILFGQLEQKLASMKRWKTPVVMPRYGESAFDTTKVCIGDVWVLGGNTRLTVIRKNERNHNHWMVFQNDGQWPSKYVPANELQALSEQILLSGTLGLRRALDREYQYVRAGDAVRDSLGEDYAVYNIKNDGVWQTQSRDKEIADVQVQDQCNYMLIDHLMNYGPSIPLTPGKNLKGELVGKNEVFEGDVLVSGKGQEYTIGLIVPNDGLYMLHDENDDPFICDWYFIEELYFDESSDRNMAVYMRGKRGNAVKVKTTSRALPPISRNNDMLDDSFDNDNDIQQETESETNNDNKAESSEPPQSPITNAIATTDQKDNENNKNNNENNENNVNNENNENNENNKNSKMEIDSDNDINIDTNINENDNDGDSIDLHDAGMMFI